MNNFIALDLRTFLIGNTWSVAAGVYCLSLAGCGIMDMGSEQGPTVSTTSSATGATASLTWDRVEDPSVTGYYIHYGKRSPNLSGSCLYDHRVFVSSSEGTVTDLDLASTYYFAVSAFNGMEGNCSNEVSTTT